MKHTLTNQKSIDIGKNITTLTELDKNAREDHNKRARGEYRILKPQNKPGGYSNLGIATALRN